MNSEAAIGTATRLNGLVQNSFSSVSALMSPPEANSAILQASASALTVPLLADLKIVQEKTYECVEKVATILQSQLDLAEEKMARERDQLTENLKEGDDTTPVVGGGNIDLSGSTEGSGFNLDKAKDFLTLGLGTALLSGAGLKAFGAGLGKKLLRGGIFGAIAGLIADPLTKYIDEEFDLQLDQEAKDKIKVSMVGAGVGLGLAGIPGAIIGATLPMIANVAKYIAGDMNATQTSDFDFGATAVGGATAAMFTASKLGGVLAGSTLPKVATFGAALASLPVIIGIGAAVAVGVGAMFIAKKIDEYQELTLNKLEKTVSKLDKEMGEWAAREEEGLFERMGLNLGNISAIGEAQVSAKEAAEQIGQDKDKFMANTEMTGKLTGLVNAISSYSDGAIETILMDKTKGENFFSTLENLKSVAAQGGFGPESGQVFANLMAMSDRVQQTAIKMLAEGKSSDPIKAAAGNRAGKIRGQIEGGDQLENLPQLEKDKEVLLLEKANVEKQLAIENQKLEDMKAKGMKGDMNIFKKNEFETQEALVEKLAGQLEFQRNDPFNLENRIQSIDKRLQKFGTTNGLLYNLDQLREIMSDAELAAIIKRSVDNTGTQYLEEQRKNNDTKENGDTIIYQDNSNKQSSTTSFQKDETYTGPLITSSDFYHDRIMSAG